MVRRATEAPADLTPADAAPLLAAAGDGALDLLLVIVTFHFINRIADQLDVPAEAMPAVARRVEPVRRLVVRAMSLLMRRIDLRPRPYPATFAAACDAAGAVLGADVRSAVAPLRARPHLVEAIRLMAEDRGRSSLGGKALARVDAVVAEALPRHRADTEGFHARPVDPLEAFAFVGTRYASRTTPAMIAALRAIGLDDLGILDLAIAVANANAWARLWRLTGLAAGLL